MFDYLAKRGRYTDEYTVLHEMAAHTGIVLMLGAIVLASLYLSLTWTFIFASAATLLRGFIAARASV
jgi:hypothetical protein